MDYAQAVMHRYRHRDGGLVCAAVAGVMAFLIVAPLAVGADAQIADAQTPKMLLVDGARVAEVRRSALAGAFVHQAALDAIIEQANAALDDPIQTVVDKPQAPPSGDLRDYVSMGPYWWPNPDTPDGLPYIRRDGEVNPQRDQYDVTRLDEMSTHVRHLALAWYFTGDERYAEQAAQWLRAWFVTPDTRMNPNLKYAQFIPGRNDGRSIGIIETTRLRWLPDMLALLESSDAWTEADQQAVRGWFSQYLDWLVHSERGQEEAAAENNHGSWCAQQVVLFALFVGDDATALRVLDTIPDRIAAQIEPDGRQPHELRRTKPFSYSEYNVRALVDLAQLGRHVGVDLWSYATPEGASIHGALDFLCLFATGETPWPEQEYPYIEDLIKAETTAQTFRRAAIALNEPRYEQVARRVVGATLDDDWINLLQPPPEQD